MRNDSLFGTTSSYEYSSDKEKNTKSTSLFGDVSVDDILTPKDPVDDIVYSNSAIDEAIKFTEETSYIIIRPTENLKELEDLFYAYNCMTREHQIQADIYSNNFFGVDNITHYKYLKALFIKNGPFFNLAKEIRTKVDLSKLGKDYLFNLDESSRVFADTANKFLRYSTESMSYQSIMSKTIDGILADKEAEIITDNIPYKDMPYFTPDQMIDLGIAPSIVSPENIPDGELVNDININEWFYNYKMNYMGFYGVSENNQSKWVSALKLLHREPRTDERDRKILSLGWNPNIDFNTDNRARVNKIQENFMKRYSSRYKIIDARDLAENDTINEAKKVLKKLLFKPLYVICIKGKCPITEIITKFTHSDIAHSTISFDPFLHDMRSFGAMNYLIYKDNGLKGGPTKENIDNFPQDNPLYVYCIFPTLEQFNKITDFVNDIEKNAEKYSYSYKTLLTIVFNREYIDNMAMVCSEFVDRVLKLSNINIGKDSSLVTPDNIKEFGKTNAKVFQMYSGSIKNYNPYKVSNITNKLLSSPEKIKAIMDTNEMAGSDYIRNRLIESCNIDIPTEIITKNKPIWYDREFLFNIVK